MPTTKKKTKSSRFHPYNGEENGATKRRITDPNWTSYSRMSASFEHHPKFRRSCTQLIRPTYTNDNLTQSDFYSFDIRTGKNEYKMIRDTNHLIVELDTKITKSKLATPHASVGVNAGQVGKIRALPFSSANTTTGYAQKDTNADVGTTWTFPPSTGKIFYF